MRKILFAASEAVPFVKTGGLADVVGSLPKYFSKEEYDIRVILPKYQCIDPAFTEKAVLISESEVPLNWRVQYAGVYRMSVGGIEYYLIDNKFYFGGESPYGEICEDAEKFAFFCMAALSVLQRIDFKPDIIHCHDWQTGLIPVFLKAFFVSMPFYSGIRTVYTIHNIKFQGRWYIDAYRDITGLDDLYFGMEALESYGAANPLKGGIVFADIITTVSENYAGEILTPEGGEGLDGLLRCRRQHPVGILNGLDQALFDPRKDEAIHRRLDEDIVGGGGGIGREIEKHKAAEREAGQRRRVQQEIGQYKSSNKRYLQKVTGIKQRKDLFLIGMVSRLTEQKGFDLISEAADKMLGTGEIQLVVLGVGEKRYENMLLSCAGKYPGRAFVSLSYSDKLARRIYAGCDAFLMPSLFEPCGVSQLVAMRYGAVPLVRETGGLKDTVRDYDESRHDGTGFVFRKFDAGDMLLAIRRAYDVRSMHPQEWSGIIERGMSEDHSWEESAQRYANVYECAIGHSGIMGRG